MGEFQRYLDNALERLDVNKTREKTDKLSEVEYDITTEISELIVTIRKEMGISQHQLSVRTGIPQANISRIENGHCAPSLSVLKRIAEGLEKRLVIDFVDVDFYMED